MDVKDKEAGRAPAQFQTVTIFPAGRFFLNMH